MTDTDKCAEEFLRLYPIADPRSCERWWGEKHTWNKWEVRKIYVAYDKCVVDRQRRTCENCGLTQERSLEQ